MNGKIARLPLPHAIREQVNRLEAAALRHPQKHPTPGQPSIRDFCLAANSFSSLLKTSLRASAENNPPPLPPQPSPSRSVKVSQG